MINRSNAVPFLIGLIVGLLIIGLVFVSMGKIEKPRSLNKTEAIENPPLKSGWGDTYGILNFDPIHEFIEKENIKIVAFFNDNDGVLISKANGEEITGWCTMNGTAVDGDCSWIKDGSRLAYFNQMAVFTTEASPGYVWIKIGGKLICYDTRTGKKCGE